MNELQTKRLKFLNDTVEHFSNNPRAIEYRANSMTCCYSHKVNGGCAIGRAVSAEVAEEMQKISDSSLFGVSVGNSSISNLLTSELKELGADFLRVIQNLHDGVDYWTNLGKLNFRGIEIVEEIKSDFKLN